MLILTSILLIIIAIALAFFAFGGIAIAITFFTKILFLLSFLCFLAAVILIFVDRFRHKRVRNFE